MAGTITYNTTLVNVAYIYRATGGGVTFSANLASSTAFDYFTDTAVTNDAIYFANASSSNQCWSDISVNVGTALAGAGVTGVWEYAKGTAGTWTAIPLLKDNTTGFTTTGVNRVRFGFPDTWRSVTVNGIARPWIRYRLTGGTVSEGGANQTSKVQLGDGRVNVSGTAAGSEATLSDIYSYMNTNYPHVAALKNNNYYDFRWFSVSFDSPTLSINEILEIGYDMAGQGNVRGNWNFDYWTTGVAVGTRHGKQGSTIVINAVTNEYPLVWTTNQKSYAAKYFSNPSKNAGYPILAGTFYDCILQIAPGSLGNGDCSNNTFEIGFGFVASSWVTAANNPFLNNKFIVMASAAWSVYAASFDINKPDITFDTGTKAVLGSQQNNLAGLVWNFIDPITPLPTITNSNKPLSTARGTDGDMLNAFFYDDSAGTYTDITTACNNATANDVSLNGDVGDCWYFNILGAATELRHPSFTMAGGANDYEYVWEYYKTSAFKSFGNQWDETANLSQTGVVWFQRGVSDITLATINSVSGYWYRLRIVTKGTTTNTATQIRRRTRPGTADWKLYYQYSMNYTARDSAGDLLDGVEVAIYDNTSTARFTGTTASGVIAAANLSIAQYRFDPLDAGRDTTNDVAQILYNPFKMVSRKYGYIPQSLSLTIAAPQVPVSIFLVNAFISANQATAHAYTGITIDGAAKTIVISEDHTMQEVYDYCQDWFSLAANMAYDEPFVTYDGSNYSSAYDLSISANLTGAGTINIGAKTLTLTGTSTLDITDTTGTYTNIKLTGLVSGSRVQLYDDTNDLELYNDIVAGTTLAFPYVWTEDLDIRVRVMYVDGVTAKAWYEATGSFVITGMTLNIAQEDDSVYNAIGIDGTTVTECEIVGTTLVIEVDDPDNTTTGQRLYAFEVAWLFTEDGIRDQSLYIEATDMTHFTFLGGLKIKNMDTTNPLNITGANIVPESGAATDVFDLSNGASIALNFNRVEGFSYSSGSGLSPEEHNALLAQKATIDTNLDSKVSQALKTATFIALK